MGVVTILVIAPRQLQGRLARLKSKHVGMIEGCQWMQLDVVAVFPTPNEARYSPAACL